MRKVILASTSPRRRQILTGTGIPFEVEAPEFEEDMTQKIPPRELVKRLALGKALAAAARHDDALIIAADTVVVFRSHIWSKPENEREANMMLKALAGTTHEVLTAFCIIDCNTGKRVLRLASTKHTLRKLSAKEIAQYVSGGHALDAAGSYNMLAGGFVLSEKIVGDFNNIIGLPLAALLKELAKFGVRPK